MENSIEAKKIRCFLCHGVDEDLLGNIAEFRKDPVPGYEVLIYVLTTGARQLPLLPEGVEVIEVDGFRTTAMLKKIAPLVNYWDKIIFYHETRPLKFSYRGLPRLSQAMDVFEMGIVYADYQVEKDGVVTLHPLIDYQDGSLRDDFDFGPLMMYSGDCFPDVIRGMKQYYSFAGLYDLRLRISRYQRILRLPEVLYTFSETDSRKSGEKIFDYVNPKNREVQVEMELACTEYLKDTGTFLKPDFEEVNLSAGDFPVEASVVIPVRNRAKTIKDAVTSVLGQLTSFDFNLIVVDNHSTDGTSKMLEDLAKMDSRLIHLIPERDDLGIGGCWTAAVMHESCGRFAVQLDSDDLYSGDDTLQTIVNAFYEQKCAMVIGAYQMVDFNLNELPPGIIDHREWTPENGRNNALRINGLGAPRAFFTPVIREIGFPNVSYGEDYAVGLAVSRRYRISRVYRPLYLCRRWDDNTDASLSVEQMNAHNLYKDRIRTIEMWIRKAENRRHNRN